MRRKKLKMILLLLTFVILLIPLGEIEAADQKEILPEISKQIESSDNSETIADAGLEAAEEGLPAAENDSGVIGEEIIAGESETEEDQENRDYIYGRPMTKAEIVQQKAMEPRLESRLNTEPEPPGSAYRRRVLLPQRYDSREYGCVTSVKDQNPFDTCWTFAIDAAAEASLILNGIAVDGEISAAENTDLSELHTAYYFYNRQTDILGLTSGDKNIPGVGYDYLSNGGNLLMSAIAFANWTGTEAEQDAPYWWAYEDVPPFSEEQQFSADAKLKNAYFISGEVSQVKAAVQRYGTVAVMYNHDAGYYNYDTGAYCCVSEGRQYTNHAVAIVGWDDTYKKENFKAASGVTHDGAWIAKNSWGDMWGDMGYFYISYEDASICNVTALEFQDGDMYQYNYQYDGSSMTTANVVGAGQKLANVFEIQGKSAEYEVVQAVSFAFQSANVPYSIQVYSDLQSDKDPTSGTAVLDAPVTGVTEYSGIYTVELPKAVRLKRGSRFSVVVSFPQETAYYSERTTDQSYSSWVSASAETAFGQSFWLNSYGHWQDLAGHGICARIKAFTNESSVVGEERVIVSAGRTDKNEILLKWDAQVGAEGYSIYRSTSPNGQFVCLDTVGEQYTAYTDSSVEPGIQYYYRVGWFATERETVMESLPSDVVSAVTTLGVPGISVASASFNSVTLAWEEIEGADKCQIMRSTQKGGSYFEIAEVDGGYTYVDGQLTTGNTYYYKIRMLRNTAGNIVYSDYSTEVAAQPRMEKPVLHGQSGGYNKAELSWEKTDGAQGYRVYCSKSKNSGYSAIRNLTNPDIKSYSGTTDYAGKTLKTGTTYYYKMRAFRTVGDVTVYSEYSDAVAVKPALKSPVLTGKSWSYNKAALNWNKVWGSGGYRIYRSTKASGGFAAIRNVTNVNTLSYTNASLTTGRTYYYKMRAFRMEDGKTHYSAYSKTVAVKPVPNRVRITGMTAPSAGKLKVGWNKVAGADGYRIYRAESVSGKYTYLRTLNGNGAVSYTDTGKKTRGKRYYYKVRAFRKVNGEAVFGTFSVVKSGVAK